MVFNAKSAIQNKDGVTNQPLQNANAITKSQFGRLLKSEKGAYEVCREFFKDSAMLKDEPNIADIAANARMFARGRKNESGALKYLAGQFLALGAGVSATALILDAPLVWLAWIPHILMTGNIAIIGTRSLPYASKIAPIFKAEDKIIKEVQSYLEYREFAKYRLSVGGNEVPISVTVKYREFAKDRLSVGANEALSTVKELRPSIN